MNDISHAPSPRLSWSDRIALGAAVFVPGFLGGTGALGNLLVLPLMEAFDVSRATVIFLIELAMVGNLLMSPIVGRILLRVPPWKVLLTGVIIGGTALLAASQASTFAGMIACFLVAGSLGQPISGVVPSQTFVVRRSPDRLGIISGAQTVWAALIGVAIALLIPPILVQEGWEAALAACGIVVLAVLPPIIILLMRGPERGHDVQSTPQPQPEGDPEAPLAAPTTLQIMRMGSFWLLVVGIVPLAIAAMAVGINVIPFLAERGVGTEEAGYVLAGIGGASAVGALLIGAIVDRVHPAYVIAGVAAVATSCLGLAASDLGNPAILFCLMYVGLAGVAPTMAVGVRRLFGIAAYSPIVGLIGPFLLLSAFSGAGTGWLRDHLGSYHPIFGLIAALCAASFLAAIALARRPLAER